MRSNQLRNQLILGDALVNQLIPGHTLINQLVSRYVLLYQLILGDALVSSLTVTITPIIKNISRILESLFVSDLISEEELQAMSSPPQELNQHYFRAPTILALNTLAATLSKRVCDPLDDPTPTDGESGQIVLF